MFKSIFQVSAVATIAIGASMITPAAAAQAAGARSDCGGLNQKTCISVNPAKWCKAGLKVKPRIGKRDICVRKTSSRPKPTPKPGKDCGGLNQFTCISMNPAKWCDTGLKVQARLGKRDICVKKGSSRPKPDKQCGGLNEFTCISMNPAKWCEPGLRVQARLGKRDICVNKKAKAPCGGLNQNTCISMNPAKWCEKGLKVKPRWGERDICIKRISNADRIAVAKDVVEGLGDDNPLANLTKCLKRPSNLGKLKDAIGSRSNGGVNSVLRDCGANPFDLAAMGSMASLNNGRDGGSDRKFKTLSITVGASGAAGVAGSAGAGIVFELKRNPNARWFFTGGIGGGPKAEVVGDVTVSVSRSSIPTKRVGFDHGVGAVVSGHYVVGLSGGVEFEGNSLDFSGISFGAGGGVGVGGAVYKTGAIFPFKDL